MVSLVLWHGAAFPGHLPPQRAQKSTLVTEGSGVAIMALTGGLATWGEVAVAVDTGLVAAGVGRLGRLVAESSLVALMALAAVGEGVEGQAQPVHTPVGTQCCQELLVAPAHTAHQH